MALVVHPRTQTMLGAAMSDLPQSLLISGQVGVGLATIARDIAGKDLVAFLQPQNVKEQVDSDNGTISVSSIRGLYRETRSKQTRRAIVIIDNADRMNTNAQSAFLKLLEEPNDHIYFILTSHQPQLLKSTILSRVQQLIIHNATTQQTDDLISSLNVRDPTKQAQLRYIASGLPAEMTRLVGDEVYFAVRAEIVGDARTLLQADRYGKLLIAQKYHSKRDLALQLIDSASMIARRTLSTKPQAALVSQLEQLLDVRAQVQANGNIRLQLARFAL